jgi:hypothetical protein
MSYTYHLPLLYFVREAGGLPQHSICLLAPLNCPRGGPFLIFAAAWTLKGACGGHVRVRLY